METYYISLGMQCAVPTVLGNLGLKKETLPFDWMLSSPKFVFTMLDLLLNKNLDTDNLVREHFFKCNKRAVIGNVEHHVEAENGNVLYNEEYKVLFPHDAYDEENIQKYINRFNRLKRLILDETNELVFIYISQSSLNGGNLTINGEEVIQDVYKYLSKIYDLILQNRKNCKVVVFDSILTEDISNLNKGIDLITIQPTNIFISMMPECEIKLKEYLNIL
jgi:hypothetical protein